jgi:hypothetical protein
MQGHQEVSDFKGKTFENDRKNVLQLLDLTSQTQPI